MNKIQEYGALKLQEKQIKARLAELKNEVTTLVEEQGGKIELPEGTLSIRVNKNWLYPQYIVTKVNSLKEEISFTQKQWQLKNQGKFESDPTITFSEAK